MLINLLITGVGGPLGQALIKAARASGVPCRIVGTDRSSLAVGFDWVERGEVLPDAAAEERYLAELDLLCTEEQVTLVLPGSDSELLLLSTHAACLRERTGAIVVAAAPEILAIALDKWETCQFLQAKGLRSPRTARLEDRSAVEDLIAAVGFPLICKPRRGSGSRGVCKVQSRADVEHLGTSAQGMLLQEYLQPDEQEYTVAVYTTRDGCRPGTICMRRELIGGNTYRAWVDQNEAVIAEAEAVVHALNPAGPCNVQLRLTNRGAVTFEINPRFSGTTAMRAHFGYNEVEMAIRDHALAEPLPRPVIRRGTALRFWAETYIDEAPRVEVLGADSRAAGVRILRTAEAKEWNGVLRRMARHDFYHMAEYHALAEKRGEGEARLFAYEKDGYAFALPVMLRPLAHVPELRATAGDWLDAVSVYGYAGPVASHEHAPQASVEEFQRALSETLRELKVVSLFSRLHPLLDQHWLLTGLGECRSGGQTVSIDLLQPMDEQWAQYSGTMRTRIRRLQRAGVSGLIDTEKRHLPEFIELYHETMRRVQARQEYFFDEDYFTSLACSLGPLLQLAVVRMPDGDIIGGGLFTLRERIVQYHLGGTRDHALNLSPMALVFDTARLWATSQHAAVFHLGGGVGSAADSLFQFKSSFSKRRHEFSTWRWVIAPEVYDELTAARERWNAAHGLEANFSDFFPAYRAAGIPRSEIAAPEQNQHAIAARSAVAA